MSLNPYEKENPLIPKSDAPYRPDPSHFQSNFLMIDNDTETPTLVLNTIKQYYANASTISNQQVQDTVKALLQPLIHTLEEKIEIFTDIRPASKSGLTFHYKTFGEFEQAYRAAQQQQGTEEW